MAKLPACGSVTHRVVDSGRQICVCIADLGKPATRHCTTACQTRNTVTLTFNMKQTWEIGAWLACLPVTSCHGEFGYLQDEGSLWPPANSQQTGLVFPIRITVPRSLLIIPLTWKTNTLHHSHYLSSFYLPAMPMKYVPLSHLKMHVAT